MAKPLKLRIWETLFRNGTATTDVIAQRISVRAKIISPRLAELRADKHVTAKVVEGGELAYTAVDGKPPAAKGKSKK